MYRETIKNTNIDTSIKSLRSLIRTIGGLPTSPILGKQINTKRISQPITSTTGDYIEINIYVCLYYFCINN